MEPEVNARAGTNPLIGTKFNRPLLMSDVVLRPRLLDKLNDGLLRKLTIISAPAGYGKTTLLLTWLETCPWKSVWLTLDEQDNYFARFCSYLIAAIRTQFADCCPATQELLRQQPIPPPEHIAGTLVNELAAIDEHFIIALDDYHLVPDADIQQFIRTLLKLLPAHIHLAIATRTDPPLPLARLRANHQQTEVRTIDLRFTLQEAMEFFHGALAEELDEGVVSDINQLAEGWTVGLRLAALSLQSGRSGTAILNGFRAGASDFVTDYLMDEVLEQQSESTQRFLLYTSILGRFCADLCDAVCLCTADNEDAMPLASPPVQSAADFLMQIKRTNLFLVALDSEQNWYRYHRLFAESLRYRLQSSVSRADIARLHRRAADWFAEHGHIEEAVEHALAGDHADLAVQLVEDQCRNLLNPIDRIVLERWLLLLPEDDTWNSPRILLARGWVHFRQWNMTALDAILDRIEYLLGANVYPQEERDFVLGQVATLRSTTLSNNAHDYHAAQEASDQAIRLLARTDRDARGLAYMMRGHILLALGKRELAIDQLLANIEDASPHGPSKTQSYIMLALLYFMAADLTEMQRIVKRMFAYAERSASVNAGPGAHYVTGLLCYEQNDLQAAETHFARMFELRHRANFIGGVVAGLGLARIHQLQNEFGKAQGIIDVLRTEHLRLENFYLLPLVEAAQAYLDLLVEDKAASLRWARSVQLDVLQNCVFNFESPVATQARIFLHYGTKVELQGFRSQLRQHLTLLRTHHYVNHVIRLNAISALIDHELGYISEALEALQEALEMAQPGGCIRAFLDAGDGLSPLLRELRGRGIAVEFISRLLDLSGQDASVGAAQDTKTLPALDEPLTRREEEILQLIGRGLTNQEISDLLTISPHTVKTHATHIYAKLGVGGRMAAMRKARQLGIIHNA